MKRTFFIIGLLLIGIIFSTKAQEISNHAIGLRFGGNDGFGAEISYQKKLKEINRLEVNLGLRDSFNAVKTSGLYEWIWNLENQFNWFAGVGAGIYSANKTSIFISGVIGVEYNFKQLPLLISLDYKPDVGIIGNLNGMGSDFGLSARYKF